MTKVVLSASKVCEGFAENMAMKDEQSQQTIGNDPLRAEARSLAISIAAIRRACGKMNPRDFPVGTAEWESICIEFARDLSWALGMGGDEQAEVPSI